MKNQNPKPVAGIVAPTPRPTPLGAAVVATIIIFPIGVIVLVMDLLLL